VTDLAIRRATPGDRPEVLALLRASLGWGDEARYHGLFAWKHEASPFGPSPAWVARDGDRMVGFRTFMRWEFELDGDVLHAARAVDTATHPDYQGRGIFQRLTLHALEELRAEGVGFVFNTPNRASRPGYLRMGWQEVGRLPVRIRPRGLGALGRIARARIPADRWPLERRALPGVPAVEVLENEELVGSLLARRQVASDLRTHRTPAYFAWRYGLASLGYRVLLVGDDARDGLVVWRLRSRQTAVEVAILDALWPPSAATHGSPVLRLLRECGADYAMALGRAMPGARSVPLPRQGPVLTWRGLVHEAAPPLARWQLTLGDVELF
jgi:GNAT superfamily N-acetyltransferase